MLMRNGMVIMTMRIRLTKSLMKLRRNDKKLIQDELCDTIKGHMKVKAEDNIYEPFEESV